MKRKLKLLSMVLVVIFNMITVFAACVAWFCSSQNAGTDSMQVKVDIPELNLEYATYKYNGEYEIEKGNDLTLLQYDGFIPENNIYNAVVVEFKITGSRINDLDGNLYFHLHCGATEYNTEYISNITEFSVTPLLINSEDPDIIYNEALENLVSSQTFVTGTEKSQDIQFNLELSTCEDAIKDGTLYVYMKVDYSKELVANFTDINVSTEQAGGRKEFVGDIEYISIG